MKFITALILFCVAARGASVWTGGGSRSWDEARNWADGVVPAVGKSANFVFDSRTGAAFEFADKFEAASVTATTNAGQFSIKAPLIRIGANIADDTADGWILEDITAAGAVVNNSAKPLALSGDRVNLSWNTVFDAAGAAISVAGGLEGGHALVKKGAADMIVSGGNAELSSLRIQDGRLAFAGTRIHVADNAEGGGFGKHYNADFLLTDGAKLRTDLFENYNNVAEISQRFQMYGKSKTDGAPSSWDAGGNHINFVSRGASMQNGAVIRDATNVSTYMIPNSTNAPMAFTMSGGAKIYCKWLVAANTWNSGYIAAYNTSFTVRGVPGAKAEEQTTLDLGGGQLHLGKRHDGNCHSSFNTMLITDGARVDNASWLCVTHEIGGIGNTIRIDKGAQVSCVGMIVGSTGWTNSVEIAGAATKVNANGGDLHIGGVGERWGYPHHNGLRITDGASLTGANTVYIGRTRTEHGGSDYGNHLLLSGGASLKSKTMIVSHAGPTKGGASSNNWARIEGRGTLWDAGGGYLLCGYGDAGHSFSNHVSIIDGAVATNVVYLTIGSSAWATSVGNRLTLANGARLHSTRDVKIGETNTRNPGIPAVGNAITVASAFWDMGGGPLFIGLITNADSPSRDNKLILRPDARVVNAGQIFIGAGRGTRTDNTLVLAGGSIAGRSLNISAGNGIDVLHSQAGIKPILLEGDIAVEAGAYVYPRAAPAAAGGAAAPAGRITLIAWKGAAKDIDKLKLHPKTDARKWKLEIDETNKRVSLTHTP